jgi:hypothetical protein
MLTAPTVATKMVLHIRAKIREQKTPFSVEFSTLAEFEHYLPCVCSHTKTTARFLHELLIWKILSRVCQFPALCDMAGYVWLIAALGADISPTATTTTSYTTNTTNTTTNTTIYCDIFLYTTMNNYCELLPLISATNYYEYFYEYYYCEYY